MCLGFAPTEYGALVLPATRPTVSIIPPVLNEAGQIERCLCAVAAQTYPTIVKVVVADAGSTDETWAVAERVEKVRVIDYQRQIRRAGLNAAITSAGGEIIVGGDARTKLAPHCGEALVRSGAAIVGGPLRFEAHEAQRRSIVAAMTSRIGAGPADFRRAGGQPRYVDAAYLGTFRTSLIREMGGHEEWSDEDEDAELAWRAQRFGRAYLDPSIRSFYLGRDGPRPPACQIYRYRYNRARTIRKHPGSLSYRQLAVLALLAGLASPWRRLVLNAYAAIVLGRGAFELTRDPPAVPMPLGAFPTMHAAWGLGCVSGIPGKKGTY